MDDNNQTYSCEPMEEQNSSYEPQSGGNQGPEAPEPKKPKKSHATAKIVALVAVVALVGSIGGSLLTAFLADLNREPDMDPSLSQNVTEGEAFQVEKHQLPDTLGSNDTGKSLNPMQVYEMNVNSVVGIRTETTTNIFGQEAVSASSGSGFILSEDGYVITNSHVVYGADRIQVQTYDNTTYPAELVGEDRKFDIAVLKIEGDHEFPAVKVGNSDELKVGEEVAAIGNPLGELTFTMTNGILSALNREINTDGNPQNMLQTNAAINSGNSGGPLFDMDGNVIGVTTAKYSGSTSSGTTIEGLGFAIPINDALKVAYDLVEYGYVKDQAYLGVTVRTLDAQTAEYTGLPTGPRVEGVNPGSCSEKAGLQVGDIIMKFGDENIKNFPQLQSALKRSKAGDTVPVTVFRSGAEVELEITLDERPPQEVLDAETQQFQQQQQAQEQQRQQEQQQQQQMDPFFNDFPFPFPFN